MKSKKLLLALALPMAFAACSNEELIENGTASSNNNLVELGDNFVLSVQGAAGTTRGVWEAGNGKLGWSWIPEILAEGTGANSTLGALNVATDEIGLCWTGELPDGTGSISSSVYTNYQFLHDGWLAEGQDAVEFNNCTQKLLNGALYSDINVGSLSEKSTLDEIKTQLKGADNYVNGQSLNLNTGIFKTSNKAIFGGSYIAYYPYNENFVDAGSLPVVSKVVFDNVGEGNVSAAYVAKNSVLVGYAKNLIGGSQASKFSMDPLSGIISLQIKGTKEIKKIALWSEDGFVTSVNLDASKIKNNGAAAGEALYVSGSKQTNATIVANLKDNVTLSETDAKRFYFPVLPTTINNLKVVLYATDESVAVIEAGNYTIGAAEGVKVAVNAKATDFVANAKIAVDNDSFKAAIAKAGTAKDPIKVTVIGDITLTADATIPAYVTVEGDKIIVPEGKTLTLADNSTIKSDVVVEGKGCCSAAGVKGGILSVEGATISGNVTVEAGEATPVAAGTINFTNSSTNKRAVVANTAVIETVGQVNFTATAKDVVINGTLTLSEDAVAEVAEGAVVAVKGGKINNNGTFEVKGDFSMLDASGSTVAEAGENFVNNGTFIDNVGAIVGGATQFMIFGEKGDYICKVNSNQRMNEAYENKTACSTIEIISPTPASRTTYTFDKVNKNNEKHNDKYVNIIVSTKDVDFKPQNDIEIGNLTVSDNSSKNELYIYGFEKDEVSGITTAVFGSITVNGDITIGAIFYTETDVKNMKANNLKVVNGGKATFKNRTTSQDKTLEVSGTIEVQKGGTFTIKAAEDGQNTAYVTCTKLIEGGTFNGKPIVVRN